jgi:predicted DNA-binding protein
MPYDPYMAKITYNTRLEEELVKGFKILAIKQGKRQNDILEEAIRDLLNKYEGQEKKPEK